MSPASLAIGRAASAAPSLTRLGVAFAMAAGPLAGAAGATVLYTPPVLPGSGDVTTCQILNVGTTDVLADFAILGVNGAVLDQANGQAVTAGYAQSIGVVSNGARYCRFTFAGNKRYFRTSISVRDASGKLLGVMDGD